MKVNRTHSLFVFCFYSLQLFAQSPIEGTWEVESISTTSPDGKKTTIDKTSIKALLVITPTHFAEVVRTIQGDSSVLRHADYGSYSLEGNKIKLTPLVTSRPGIEGQTFDVAWAVKGTEATFVTVSNDSAGRKNITERKVRKVNLPAQLSGEVLGTWTVVTGKSATGNESRSFDSSNQQLIQVITPTHLVTVYSRNQRFTNMVVFPVIRKGDIVEFDMEHRISSLPWHRVVGFASSQFSWRTEEGKLRINWTNVYTDGSVSKREELLERVER